MKLYRGKTAKSIFPRKVDKERITIRLFLASGFGLRICAEVFFQKSSETVSNDVVDFCMFTKNARVRVHNLDCGVRIRSSG